MSINFDFNFWTLLFCGLNFSLALFSLVSNRNKAAADELKAMKTELVKELHTHSDRLARIESDIDNSIDDDDIKAVHRRVDEISVNLGKVDGQLGMLVKSVEEISRHILRGSHV